MEQTRWFVVDVIIVRGGGRPIIILSNEPENCSSILNTAL
jgi:hypothetical protein